MKEVEIKITDFSREGIQAMAFYEGLPIDQHFHSSESWLLDDWGFFNKENYFSHDKKMMEVVKEPFILKYESLPDTLYKGKVFTRNVSDSR